MNAATQISVLTFGVQAFVTLLVILDPPGATPIFLALVGKRARAEQRVMAWQAAAVSLGVIIAFALFGRLILSYLHISIDALQGAGGLLLLLISLDLLTGKSKGEEVDGEANIALVPLGTPLLAGPGAIVTTMLYVQRAESTSFRISLLIAIIGVHLVIGLTLMFSTSILRIIKESGVTLMARIAGLLLAAIAVDMIVAAIKGLFAL